MYFAETLPSNRTVPIVMTVAVHVLIAYGLAVSFGIVPKPIPEGHFHVVDVPAINIEAPKEDHDTFDPNALKFRPSNVATKEPVIQVEIETGGGPGEGEITVGREIEPPPIAPQMTQVRLLRSTEPPYPTISQRMSEEGVVLVRATITPYGTIGDVVVQTSSGFPRLDDAAIKAVREWRFAPAMRGSQAIAGTVIVPVRFSLKGR
jgi:protein TonB